MRSLCAFLFVLMFITSSAAYTIQNVLNFGAKGDSKTDSTQPFLKAWDAACKSSNSVTIYIPPGRYLLRNVLFSGENCKNSDITIRIDGTLIAPLDYRIIGTANSWLMFKEVDGVKINGGTLDGRGSGLWACKSSSGNNCPTGAYTLAFYNSKNIEIHGLTSINSQIFHIVLHGCENASLQKIQISASGESPNTDGIHLQSSTNITILHSHIATGDDCVSIGPGNTNLWIEDITCGPGHGISIGSLGWSMQEAGVQNVTVKNVTFKGTTNGVRIKTWARPSKGFVKDVLFQHLKMVNVENPIIIDQNYCPNDNNCPRKNSGIKINGVKYEDIRGTSATVVAVKFDCSKKHPCNGIQLQDVNLSYNNQKAEASCLNAAGSTNGLVQPRSCL